MRQKKWKQFALSLVAMALAGAAVAADEENIAADAKVQIKDGKVSVADVKIKKGRRVVIENGDKGKTHNLFSLSKGAEIETVIVFPQRSISIAPTFIGRSEIECAVHPQEKFTVHVAKE